MPKVPSVYTNDSDIYLKESARKSPNRARHANATEACGLGSLKGWKMSPHLRFPGEFYTLVIMRFVQSFILVNFGWGAACALVLALCLGLAQPQAALAQGASSARDPGSSSDQIGGDFNAPRFTPFGGAGGNAPDPDPRFGTLENNKWCTSDGQNVNCTADLPPANDNRVGPIVQGRWCSAHNGQIHCTNPPPPSQDWRIGGTHENYLCRGTGTGITCDQWPATVAQNPRFSGGAGPYCIIARGCPTGYFDGGVIGILTHTSTYCPFPVGGRYTHAFGVGGQYIGGGAWMWCLPRLCCAW